MAAVFPWASPQYAHRQELALSPTGEEQAKRRVNTNVLREMEKQRGMTSEEEEEEADRRR